MGGPSRERIYIYIYIRVCLRCDPGHYHMPGDVGTVQTMVFGLEIRSIWFVSNRRENRCVLSRETKFGTVAYLVTVP